MTLQVDYKPTALSSRESAFLQFKAPGIPLLLSHPHPKPWSRTPTQEPVSLPSQFFAPGSPAPPCLACLDWAPPTSPGSPMGTH